MKEIIFDDIGSYPLPEGVSREWVQNAFKTRAEDEKLFTVINDAFQQKIDAGVEVPTYPPVSGHERAVPEGYPGF